MSRQVQRGLLLLFFFGLGGWLIYLGFAGWVFNDLLPAQYVGYFFTAVGVAGLCGLNIWRDGPLDPRNDAKDEALSDPLMERRPEIDSHESDSFSIKLNDQIPGPHVPESKLGQRVGGVVLAVIGGGGIAFLWRSRPFEPAVVAIPAILIPAILVVGLGFIFCPLDPDRFRAKHGGHVPRAWLVLPTIALGAGVLNWWLLAMP